MPSGYASGAVRGEWTRRTAGGCSNSVPWPSLPKGVLAEVGCEIASFIRTLLCLILGWAEGGPGGGKWAFGEGGEGGDFLQVWSFFQNPQWRFDVPAEGLDELMLFLESPGVSVNVRVFTGAIAPWVLLRG